MEMQVKRFELFREDVRDLVELTVGRISDILRGSQEAQELP